jgi:hypothetical protein
VFRGELQVARMRIGSALELMRPEQVFDAD